MRADSSITLAQLASAVYGSDGFPTAVRRHLVEPIVRLAARRLALAGLGGGRVSLDLGNGYELLVQVRRPSQLSHNTTNAADTTINPLEQLP